MRTEEEKYKTNEDACALVMELEAVQTKHGLTTEQLYDVATDESRKEYFVRMFKLLQEYTS